MTKREKTYLATYVPNTYKFAAFSPIITYSTAFESWNAFNYIGVPNNYLHLTRIYLKLSFYNSKLGGRSFFHTNSLQPEGPELSDFYLPLDISKVQNNLVYNFIQQGDINLYELKNIKLLARERQNNTPQASNISTKNLILGSGDVI